MYRKIAPFLVMVLIGLMVYPVQAQQTIASCQLAVTTRSGTAIVDVETGAFTFVSDNWEHLLGWSSDGESLYTRNSSLAGINHYRQGEQIETIYWTGAPQTTFSTETNQIAYLTPADIPIETDIADRIEMNPVIYDIPTDEHTVITDLVLDLLTVNQLIWSPSGESLAWTEQISDDAWRIQQYTLADETLTTLSHQTGEVHSGNSIGIPTFAYSPDGSTIAWTKLNESASESDDATETGDDELLNLVKSFPQPDTIVLFDVATREIIHELSGFTFIWLADSRLLYVTEDNEWLLFDPQNPQDSQPLPDTGHDYEIGFSPSPDGEQLAYTGFEIPITELWYPQVLEIMTLSTGETRQLRPDDDSLLMYTGFPLWSPACATDS